MSVDALVVRLDALVERLVAERNRLAYFAIALLRATRAGRLPAEAAEGCLAAIGGDHAPAWAAQDLIVAQHLALASQYFLKSPRAIAAEVRELIELWSPWSPRSHLLIDLADADQITVLDPDPLSAAPDLVRIVRAEEREDLPRMIEAARVERSPSASGDAPANQRYYFETAPGRWRGKFTFRVTSWRALRRSSSSWLDTLMAVALHFLGACAIGSETRADPRAGTVIDRVRIFKWFFTLWTTEKTYSLGAGGRRVDVEARGNVGFLAPFFRARDAYAVSVFDGGRRSVYRVKMLGDRFLAQCRAEEDGSRVSGELTSAWGTASEELERVPNDPPEVAHYACPSCRGALALVAGSLACAGCNSAHDAQTEVLNFLPGERRARAGLFDLERIFDLFAPIYESKLYGSMIFLLLAARGSDSLEKLVSFVDSVVGSRKGLILDAACGPGTYARRLAGPDRRVYGVDMSAGMLERGALYARRERVQNLQLVRARVEALPFASNLFDAAVCGGSLHLFEDPIAALREIARTMKPGAPLACITFVAGDAGILSRPRIRRYLDQKKLVRSLSTADLPALLDRAGFEEYRATTYGSLMTFRAQKRASS